MAALLSLALLGMGLALPARAGEAGISAIYLRGNWHPGDYGEFVGDQITLMVRPILEGLGDYPMVWSPEEQSLTVYGAPESPVVVRVGDPVMQLKDRTVTLSLPPYISRNRLHLPTDFFRQGLGARVEWIPATRELEITPYPYSQVGEFGPPGAGPATFSAIGRDGHGRLYLAVADGPRTGLWRSADQGASWQQIDEGLTGPFAGARFLPAPGETAYLLLGGALWSRPPQSAAWSRVAMPVEGEVVAAAVQSGGELWVALDRHPEDGQALAYDLYRLDPPSGRWQPSDLDLAVTGLTADSHSRLWAYGKWGAAVRENGAWAPIEWEPTLRVFQIVAHADDPRWVWALTHEGIRVSQDGGRTWQFSQLPFPADPAHYADYRLAQGVGTELFLLAGSQGVYYSPTGGGQWFRLTGYWPVATVVDAAMEGDRLFLATTSGGVIIPERIPQPEARQLPRLAPRPVDWGPDLAEGHQGAGGLWLDPEQPDTAYALLTTGGRGRLYRTVDGGATWDPLPLPFTESQIGPILFLHPTRSGSYGVQGSSGLWVTEDGGESWRHLPQEFTPRQMLSHLTMLPSGRILGVFESRGGSSLVYTDDLQRLQRAEGAPGWHITSLVANPAVPDRLYACDWDDRHPCRVSVDGGATWTVLESQPPKEAGWPIQLSWSPAAPDELFAGRFVSRDGGKSWEAQPFWQAADRVLQIAIRPGEPQVRAAVLATDQGHQVLVTRDGGQSWTSLGRPPGAQWAHAVRFDTAGRLWVGTDAGIFRLNQP